MSNLFTERVLNMTAVTPQPEDYMGEDGLLYCGKCHTPKEAYFPEKQAALFGRDRHPAECDCQKAQRLEREAAEQRRKHLDTVEDLKRRGFTNPTMQEWTFANDNGKCPQMEIAHFYVEHWEIMREENIGYLLWGKVGTGKSYFAGCIANALMEQEVAVRMTNFSAILNDLTASFEGRNEYIERLCRFPLLIIDDFGMERGTEYGLEQVYNVIDSRYRSRKPLIVTTNLTLDSLQNPLDTAHARIYDRLLEMCAPILFTGENFRRETAQATLGGRPYLFNGGLPPGGSDGSGTPGIDYQIPAEALTDSEFAAIYKEAQKYVGTPYVWGGSSPETGFDCSGYVCWVYNQNGYDVGRTTANGLWQKSQHISEAEAKPGDLVFFKGTYDTPGMSHTGIYLGNGMMVSAGDPIKYANIHSSYWEKHLAGFGRLSK